MVDKKKEKYRSQNRLLRYAIHDLCRFVTCVFCITHRPTNQEILDPVENLISKLEASEFLEENGMINPVKDLREIKEDQVSDMSWV